VHLPVMPPVRPMLAKLARELPPPDGLLYEPKWDGFLTQRRSVRKCHTLSLH